MQPDRTDVLASPGISYLPVPSQKLAGRVNRGEHTVRDKWSADAVVLPDRSSHTPFVSLPVVTRY